MLPSSLSLASPFCRRPLAHTLAAYCHTPIVYRWTGVSQTWKDNLTSAVTTLDQSTLQRLTDAYAHDPPLLARRLADISARAKSANGGLTSLEVVVDQRWTQGVCEEMLRVIKCHRDTLERLEFRDPHGVLRRVFNTTEVSLEGSTFPKVSVLEVDLHTAGLFLHECVFPKEDTTLIIRETMEAQQEVADTVDATAAAIVCKDLCTMVPNVTKCYTRVGNVFPLAQQSVHSSKLHTLVCMPARGQSEREAFAALVGVLPESLKTLYLPVPDLVSAAFDADGLTALLATPHLQHTAVHIKVFRQLDCSVETAPLIAFLAHQEGGRVHVSCQHGLLFSTDRGNGSFDDIPETDEQRLARFRVAVTLMQKVYGCQAPAHIPHNSFATHMETAIAAQMTPHSFSNSPNLDPSLPTFSLDVETPYHISFPNKLSTDGPVQIEGIRQFSVKVGTEASALRPDYWSYVHRGLNFLPDGLELPGLSRTSVNYGSIHAWAELCQSPSETAINFNLSSEKETGSRKYDKMFLALSNRNKPVSKMSVLVGGGVQESVFLDVAEGYPKVFFEQGTDTLQGYVKFEDPDRFLVALELNVHPGEGYVGNEDARLKQIMQKSREKNSTGPVFKETKRVGKPPKHALVYTAEVSFPSRGVV